MGKVAHCRSCGKVKELRECVECGDSYCCVDCSAGWVGDICPFCQQDNPVFFDKHSRTHGDVNKDQGDIR